MRSRLGSYDRNELLSTIACQFSSIRLLCMVSVVVVQHVRNFFAQNSSLVIIPVLGPVLRTRIKDLYYDSTGRNLSSLVIML